MFVVYAQKNQTRAKHAAATCAAGRHEEVDAWRLRLHREFDAAFATTGLPERPDYERANAYLLRVRRSMVS